MKNKIIIIMILIVCITVMCFSLCSSVFAAELDSEAIYNFNQIGDFSRFVSGSSQYPISINDNSFTITSNSTSTSYYYFSARGNYTNSFLYNGHIFYVSFNALLSFSSSVVCFIPGSGSTFYNSPVLSANVSTKCSGLVTVGTVTSDTGLSFGFNDYQNIISGSTAEFSNIVFIDLTLMFGSGNEPTIEQCQKIFTADYYNYTTGTPLSLSGVNTYQQGVSDTLNSYNVVTLPSVTTSSIFALNLGNFESSVVTGIDDNGVPYAICKGYFGIPFGTLIPKNTTISFKFSLISVVSYSNYSNLSFGYVSSSGSYVPVYVFDYTSSGTVSSNNWQLSDSFVSFTLPIDTEYLVFSCIPSSSSVGLLTGFSVSNCNFTYKVFNNQILIDNAYNSGYNAGSTAGYNNAYQQGYTAGLADGTSNDYSFLGLISSVIEAPVNVLIGEYDSSTGLRVGGLLNFEFLGYNMSTLLMSLFSLGVVICIIRLFI